MIETYLPILSNERLDYLDGQYEVRVSDATEREGRLVHHSVTGQNLVASMIKSSRAAFVSEVVSPYSTYRRFYEAKDMGKDTVSQSIEWDNQDVVPPIYIRPMVVATNKEPLIVQLDERHGVHEIWRGIEVEIHRGAILAIDEFWKAFNTMQSLIRLSKFDELPEGAYKVVAMQDEGFYFKILMSASLFDWMVSTGNSQEESFHIRSILTGCLSRGLELIKENFGSTEARKEFPVLRSLYDQLVELELPTWEDGDAFRPDEVATRLRPIEFTVERDQSS